MKAIYYMLIGSVLSSYSCKRNAIFDRSESVGEARNVKVEPKLEPAKGPTPEALNPTTGDVVDERVDTPQNIAGSFLTCSYEVRPDEAHANALFGCRIDSSDGQRQAIKEVASSFSYTPTLSEGLQGVTVSLRVLENDNRYDVLFLLGGKLNPELIASAESMVITASFQGNGADLVLKGNLADVLKPSRTLPEARLFDYFAAIDRIIEDNAAGITTPLVLEALPTVPEEKGAKLYADFCQSCHGLKGADPTNIRNPSRESIIASLGTTAAMKNLQDLFTADDVTALETYLKN